MANQWFNFKQFSIRQEQCAMKVGTDGVILGSWASVDGVYRVLDIGTGTGLLALMLAQRSELLTIDAIELDRDAALQARENVTCSRFRDRITVLNGDFRTYDSGNEGTFDLVICNPPFFNASKKPINKGRSLARHSDTLSLEDIIAGSVGLMSERGRISIIIPVEGFEGALNVAVKEGLNLARTLYIHPLPDVSPKRVCIEFSKAREEPISEQITIETGQRHVWTEKYRLLTKDFYLAF